MSFLKYFVISASLSVFCLSGQAWAAGSIKANMVYRDGKHRPSVTAYAQRDFMKLPLGVSGTVNVTPTWGQFFFGPTYRVLPFLRLELGAGFEQCGNDYIGRYVLAVYTASVKRKTLDLLSLGVYSKARLGTGPMVQVDIPKTGFAVWGAWTPYLWDEEAVRSSNGFIGIIANFD